jgi:hypothetical protein
MNEPTKPLTNVAVDLDDDFMEFCSPRAESAERLLKRSGTLLSHPAHWVDEPSNVTLRMALSAEIANHFEQYCPIDLDLEYPEPQARSAERLLKPAGTMLSRPVHWVDEPANAALRIALSAQVAKKLKPFSLCFLAKTSN